MPKSNIDVFFVTSSPRSLEFLLFHRIEQNAQIITIIILGQLFKHVLSK